MVATRLAVAACCALLPLGVTSTLTAHAAPRADRVVAAQKLAGSVNAAQKLKSVRYRGYTFRVPVSWPVIDDGSGTPACVRFDQHAVYLGAVRADEFCPSWLLGTTESILIAPASARAARASSENPVARQITARAPGISVFATFDTDPALVSKILASASLPAPVIAPAGQAAVPGPGGGPQGRSRLDGTGAMVARPAGRPIGTRRPMATPLLPATVAGYSGLGFDACSAPSMSTMRRWRRASPYRAIGIYVGGADRACAQPNLSQAWVRREAASGWRFIPLYAGPQAAFGELSRPERQGRAAARDAAVQMHLLGFGRRTPVYYDMEAFDLRVRVRALRFLSAWTTELRRLGYLSGIYSSDSGIVDLSAQFSRKIYAMPNVIDDALWNGSATTRDGNLRRGQWHHRRIHQFTGNATQRFGGRLINIDKEFLDVHLRPRPATAQPARAVTLPDGSVDLFFLSHGDQLWFDRFAVTYGWSKAVRTSATPASEPSVVWTGSAVDVFYKGGGGYLWQESYRPDGTMTSRHRLSMMGIIGSAPRAVTQPDGAIDVFWHGSADDHLWHGQYLPGSGWTGPQGLGGSLASWPAPVVSAPGTTTVLWEGSDRNLWSVSRGLLGRWSAPHDLGMGPLGGQPVATAQPHGGIQVYWHGSGNTRVWEGFYQPGRGWRGPRDLGGAVSSAPWPVTAAGTVRVLWRAPGHRLSYIRHRLGHGWNAIGSQGPYPLSIGWLGSAPFASVGSPAARLQVFWQGRQGRLWTAFRSRSGWSKPTKLAG